MKVNPIKLLSKIKQTVTTKIKPKKITSSLQADNIEKITSKISASEIPNKLNQTLPDNLKKKLLGVLGVSSIGTVASTTAVCSSQKKPNVVYSTTA